MRRARLAVALALAVAGNALSQDEPREPTWQDEMAKGMVPYRQLTVDDFQIKDAASAKYNVYIQGAIDPQYRYRIKPANGFHYAYIDRWTVFSGLDKWETYRKRNFNGMKASLPYAQAILDLNEICARRLAALKTGELPSVRGNTFAEAEAGLKRKVTEFLQAKYKELQEETDEFAKATADGANKKKVRELAAEIRKRLEATPDTTVPFTEATATPGSSPSVLAPTPNVSPAASAAPIPSPSATRPKRETIWLFSVLVNGRLRCGRGHYLISGLSRALHPVQ